MCLYNIITYIAFIEQIKRNVRSHGMLGSAPRAAAAARGQGRWTLRAMCVTRFDKLWKEFGTIIK